VKQTIEELKIEITRGSKQILADLEDYLRMYPDPKNQMTSKTSFICRSYALMGIMFEIFLMNEPKSIQKSLKELASQDVISHFYCPCGAVCYEETNLLFHLRNRHKDSEKMYISMKKSLNPYYDMSDEHYEEKYNVYVKMFKNLKEVTEG